jgi:hypothetical protein
MKWMPQARRCQYRTAHRRRAGAVAVCGVETWAVFVGEICGSPIRSNGRRKLGSRGPRTRCGIAQLQLSCS